MEAPEGLSLDNETPGVSEFTVSFDELNKISRIMALKKQASLKAKRRNKVEFRRNNKNRPQEVSSKKLPRRYPTVLLNSKTVFRDPRFDSLCGTFNEKEFHDSYQFIDVIKDKERKELKKMLHKCGPSEAEKIKLLLSKMKNQDLEKKKKLNQLQEQEKEREHIIKALEEGKNPRFKTKAAKRFTELVSQYDSLKKRGKIEKYFKKKNKKTRFKE